MPDIIRSTAIAAVCATLQFGAAAAQDNITYLSDLQLLEIASLVCSLEQDGAPIERQLAGFTQTVTDDFGQTLFVADVVKVGHCNARLGQPIDPRIDDIADKRGDVLELTRSLRPLSDGIRTYAALAQDHVDYFAREDVKLDMRNVSLVVPLICLDQIDELKPGLKSAYAKAKAEIFSSCKDGVGGVAAALEATPCDSVEEIEELFFACRAELSAFSDILDRVY